MIPLILLQNSVLGTKFLKSEQFWVAKSGLIIIILTADLLAYDSFSLKGIM